MAALLGTLSLAGAADAADPDCVNVDAFVTRGVMMYGDTSRGGTPFAKDPAVVRHGDRYLLYYSVKPGRGVKGWRIGIAESGDLVTWRKVSELDVSAPCEANGFCAPGAAILNGRVHLFYQTYGNRRKDAICHTWSEDGITFTRNPANPVFSPTGDWHCGRAIDADVIAHEGCLLLYYATRDPDFRVQMQGVASAPLESDFGPQSWTQHDLDGPILKPELPWEKQCIEAAALCRHDDRLYMFYAGGYNNDPQQVGCAVSDDGIHWERLSDTPILPNGGPDDWNASESGHPFAFTDEDGTVHLFYQGNRDNGKSWYLSRVQIGWENGRPVVVP